MAERYAGIDWAADKHDVLVADETGGRCSRRPTRTMRTG
jgi:hypothetical protein